MPEGGLFHDLSIFIYKSKRKVNFEYKFNNKSPRPHQNMKKHKKLPSQPIPNQLQQQQQQYLQPQWQIHDNRLTFLEQSMTKLQKKFMKLEKAVVMLSEAEAETKDQFKEKLNQMIAVISQPDAGHQCKFDEDKFNRWKRQINAQVQLLKSTSQEYSFSSQVAIAQINKHVQKIKDGTLATLKNQKRELQELINTTMHTVQMNTTKFIQDKFSQISLTIHKLEQSISANCVSMKNRDINTIQAQSNDTPSLYSKPYPRSFLMGSNQKSLAKLSNSRSSRLFQQNQQPSSSSKRLTQQANIDMYEVRSHNSGSLKHLPPYPTPLPPSQNSSRVVYLRQKLKEFQAINKKYEKKQVEFENLQRQLVFEPQSSPSSSKHSHSNSSQRQVMLMNRENSGKKSFTNMSSGKSVMKSNLISAQNSAKRIDKLKSIKDYLEQTQSQAQESFLQPNYQ